MSSLSPELPTRLFSLAPMGSGTATGESLLSYLVRLARAHAMSPRQLVRTEVLPLAGLGGGPACGRFHADQARTLAGVGKYARAFVSVLEGLTGRGDLGRLTMMPWANVLPPVGFGLIADQVRWCPECLVLQRQADADSHFPLTWLLDCYQACPWHARLLACSCPWCGRTQHAVPDYPDQHRCTHCRGHLGSKHNDDRHGTMPTERQLHRAFLIEDMLADGDGAESWATHANLCRRLMALADAWTDGETRALSLCLGLSKTSVSTWVAKQQRPVFPQLLHLCEATRLSVRALLTDIGAEQPMVECVPASVTVAPRRPLPQAEKREAGARLDQLFFAAAPRPSAAQAAAELGMTIGQMRYRHRATMSSLSQEYRAYRAIETKRRWMERVQTVHFVVRSLASEGINPSRRQMTDRLRHLRLSLQNPRLRAAYREVRAVIDASGGTCDADLY